MSATPPDPAAPPVTRIDRIDDNGNIREHVVHPQDPTKTLCGLVIYNSQDACGNRQCGSCARIVRARAARANGVEGRA